MIRVVYRWWVEPQNFPRFKESWSVTTNRIHETVPGAQGSFILRGCENESEIITVAKWDSLKAWKDFWQNEDPDEMKGMRMLGERLSATAYEELEDHTR